MIRRIECFFGGAMAERINALRGGKQEREKLYHVQKDLMGMNSLMKLQQARVYNLMKTVGVPVDQATSGDVFEISRLADGLKREKAQASQVFFGEAARKHRIGFIDLPEKEQDEEDKRLEILRGHTIAALEFFKNIEKAMQTAQAQTVAVLQQTGTELVSFAGGTLSHIRGNGPKKPKQDIREEAMLKGLMDAKDMFMATSRVNQKAANDVRKILAFVTGLDRGAGR